jgi:hypothetical protein
MQKLPMQFVDKESSQTEVACSIPTTICELLNEDSQGCGFECETAVLADAAAAPDPQRWDMRPIISIMTAIDDDEPSPLDCCKKTVKSADTSSSPPSFTDTAFSITSDDEENNSSTMMMSSPGSSCCQDSSRWHEYKLNFPSVLLFFLGSAFYVWLAVVGYLWVTNLQPIPINVLTSIDDDATWYTTMTDYDVTYDDDNLIQIGTTEYQITKYQVIYFIASFCFALAGLLDIIAERRWYNLFRLFGGLFGMVSAIVLSVNELASSMTNAISVHLYLFDAIGILWSHYMLSGTTISMLENSIVITIVIIIGLMSYLLGTLSDVVVSILYNDDALSSSFLFMSYPLKIHTNQFIPLTFL